ncbi:MAG: tetratricopeptide repeat protein [Pirellulales bacterium]|nr:tetratricopeptide repeat protein [Pirellulales bacterium]
MSDSRRNPLLCQLYQRYLDDQDSAAFMSGALSRYEQGTLQRLAENPRAEIRRGAILALGFLGDYDVNHTIGRALHDHDRTVRILAENGIRNVWARAGSGEQRQRLAVVARLIAAQQYHEAIARATELIEQAGWFGEAWNQRAVAHFRLGRFVEAIRDCHEALEVNPYHFDAAASMGQAYLQLRNQVSALECFRRALRLNPNLEGVRVQIDRLSRSIEGR